MRTLAQVIFDEAHRPAWSTDPELAAKMNPANPKDAGYTIAAETLRQAGFETKINTETFDGATAETANGLDTPSLDPAATQAIVLLHGSEDAWEATTKHGSPTWSAAEIDSIHRYVQAGGGLVILAETEQLKYGNSTAEIAARFGIEIENLTVQDSVNNYREVATWVLGNLVNHPKHNLLAGVQAACFYRAGALKIAPAVAANSFALATTSASATPPNAPLIVCQESGLGRVVIIADSDLFGDDSIGDLNHQTLWQNLVTWAATPATGIKASQAATQENWTKTHGDWPRLVDAVEGLRELQNKDGSLTEAADRGKAAKLVEQACDAIGTLAQQPRFKHQAAHLEATIQDFKKWQAGGFAVPDFLDSLMLFRPDLNRSDRLENLVVFPMYTQNGNPNRNFEAVIARTVWPTWLAELERNQYQNPAFVPIEFVAFTKGYDTNSAVLFPETVATRELAKFSWGGIFCDREAARFRVITSAAADLLRLSLPAEAEMLLVDQGLAQETYMLWDLVHDRAHSHGELPFDPFMIKQRMPFWMYALEELRCDLTTFRESLKLQEQGVYLAPFMRHAILFDRLFRFPITGDRVRNYDGLGGQLIFAWLHKNEVLLWRDNTVTLDWQKVNSSIIDLGEAIEDLYSKGIDRSRLSHWLASYEFVSAWVQPHPSSVWAKGVDALPVDGQLREVVDKVMPDEFPLNVFYETLRKKLATAITETAGITA